MTSGVFLSSTLLRTNFFLKGYIANMIYSSRFIGKNRKNSKKEEKQL